MSGKRPPVIAVDGPAGAGKSTVARRVAEQLGLTYLDSGAMYRALAMKALRHGVDLRDENELLRLLTDTVIELRTVPGEPSTVLMDGDNVTEQLRTPEVNASVSLVAGFFTIREEMVKRQRQLARLGGVVMDGRDIGTHVLPDADLKFYLTASLEARAHRRLKDLERMGYRSDLNELANEIRHRDMLDTNRPFAPLRQARDAILVDTTDMEVDRVVDRIIALCRQHIL